MWMGFGAMCLGMFMAILDVQIVATSLPEIQSAVGILPDQMSWVQTAYLIAEAIAIPLTGWLTRVLGMRGLFVIAVSGFTIASIGCAASPDFASLIACRIVQGFAGGTLIPAVFSAVFVLFPFHRQGIATTVAGGLAVLAPTVGPIASGWITETFSWHWLFLINVTPGILAALVARAMLPAAPMDLRHARTLDWLSLALLAITLAGFEITLKEAPRHSLTSFTTLVPCLITILSGAAFVGHSLKSGAMIDLNLFRDREFAIGCWWSFLLGMALYGSVYLMPVFLAFVRMREPLDIGEIMLVTGATQLITAPLVVQLERRYDARLLTGTGFALFAIGLGLSYLQTWQTDFAGMFWPQLIRGSAIMLCLLPPTRLALGHLPPAQIPEASGLFNLMRNLGGAIGIGFIDTTIQDRTPYHVKIIISRLLAGDAYTARSVGLPTGHFLGKPLGTPDMATQDFIRPLIARAGLVDSINEAWAMLACFMVLALLVMPLVMRRRHRRT